MNGAFYSWNRAMVGSNVHMGSIIKQHIKFTLSSVTYHTPPKLNRSLQRPGFAYQAGDKQVIIHTIRAEAVAKAEGSREGPAVAYAFWVSVFCVFFVLFCFVFFVFEPLFLF